MRFLGTAFVILLLLALPGHSAANSCKETAKTQLDSNKCADTEFRQADNELNTLYKQILSEYADDPKFIGKFKASQRAWLKFRDAEMEALFPHSGEANYYGSILPMCYSEWMKVLTEERIAQLRKWSDKAKEGDVCSGSIKVKE